MTSLRDVYQNVLSMKDEAEDEINQQVNTVQDLHNFIGNIENRDVQIGFQKLVRYQNTEYDSIEDREQVEEEIDALFIPHDHPAPFEQLDIERADVDVGWSRRGIMKKGVAGLLGASIVAYDAGNYADDDTPDKGGLLLPGGSGDIDGAGALENHRAAEGSSDSDYNVREVTISDSDLIGNYLEDEVQDSDFLSAERNWGDLVNAYDFEEEEFYSDSDRELESLDLIFNDAPGEHSEYGLSVSIDGSTEFDTRTLKDDRAAENALEYFEVNQ